MSEKKIRHDYTSELELKSLLIRTKNRESDFSEKENKKINKYIKWHTDIGNIKYSSSQKKVRVRDKLKEKIISLSERTKIDKLSYERFGEVVLLMIMNVLKKPNFSGYTYNDDFYSDAVYKILKYLHNFDHTLISKRTGVPVNAFAYISQYIHNSFIYVIKTKKKDQQEIKKHIIMERLANNISIANVDWVNNPSYNPDEETYCDNHLSCDNEDDNEDDSEKLEEKVTEEDYIKITEKIELNRIGTSLVQEIKNLSEEINSLLKLKHIQRIEIVYPKDYRITMDEYNELKPLLRGNTSITRSK